MKTKIAYALCGLILACGILYACNKNEDPVIDESQISRDNSTQSNPLIGKWIYLGKGNASIDKYTPYEREEGDTMRHTLYFKNDTAYLAYGFVNAMSGNYFLRVENNFFCVMYGGTTLVAPRDIEKGQEEESYFSSLLFTRKYKAFFDTLQLFIPPIDDYLLFKKQ